MPLQNSIVQRTFHTSPFVLAVPKERRSKRRKHIRTRERYQRPVVNVKSCSNCKTPVFVRHVCGKCGWYNGKPFTLRAIAKHEKVQQLPKEQPQPIETVVGEIQ